ncbi:hypothetical protein Poli38472_003406 [Pythium oligandrum]|uniref:Nardilysin n=1 Tax=Pythium oligandrum TaxID=41045 RepID=A0A8K1FCR3_PYTOL|nr:hypothetical protein Poli38472_003406 [Pythium oligandrum]|eukprot:TMW57481.1 hypothetical protein Poli38472_003406 [Pythium oligandrum]
MSSMSLDAFRSPGDKKQYRVFTLPNGLEALVIHRDVDATRRSEDDEVEPEEEPEQHPPQRRASHVGDYETDSESDDDDDDASDDDGSDSVNKSSSHLAAACLTVGVGSMADPDNLRGLAHYLEHMLFMGSAKYPDENEFEAFLSTHGGYSNGTTECESTRYLFEVAPRHLRQALDMFAQFFVAPLFKEEAMERELLAIESEFHRAMQNDFVRLQQVQCETASPTSRFNSFSWGNMESLKTVPEQQGINVRDTMISFFHKYYAAHRMKLCVIGEDSLDDLETWVRESFDALPKRDVGDTEVPRFAPPFGQVAGQKPTLVRILPVRKTHAMHLYWPLPPLMPCYRQKPWEYLSHAMGHEGKASLSTILKDRLWATEVFVGISDSDAYEFGSFGCLFEVNVSLTKLGLAHWEEVGALIFQVIRYLCAEELRPWMFNELRAASEMNFQFHDEPYALSLCRRLSELMQRRYGVDRADLLRYDVVQGKFDPQMTRSMLEWMTPENTRVLLLSHAFADDADGDDWQSERWIGVKYSRSAIAAKTLEQWKEPITDVSLSYPEPNPFMPESFAILPLPDQDDPSCESLDPDIEPKLVLTTGMSKLWFKRDIKFRVPKMNANFLLCLPSLTTSVRNYMHAKIYLRLIYEALQHVQYQAYLANLSFDMSVRDLDIELTFSGFNDKLPTLIHSVIRALLETEIDGATFTLVRDEMLKEYRNLHLKPSVKARYMRLLLLERTTFSIEDKMRVLSETSADAVRQFKDEVLWQCQASLWSLIHGNVSRDDAIALLRSVEDQVDTYTVRFSPTSPQRPHTTALPLTTNGLLLRDESEHDEETNSVVEVYYQIGRGSFEDYTYAELLQQIMAEPLFHELRTQQQLGYEVYCMVRETHGVLGFSVSVQSASHSTGEIALRIDEFLHETFWLFLQNLSAEVFQKHLESVKRMKTREDATLSEETDRYWEEVHSRRLAFRFDEPFVEALVQCTPDGLMDRYAKWLLTANDVGASKDDAQVRKLRVHVVGKNSKQALIESLVPNEHTPLIIDNVREYKAALQCCCHHHHHHHHPHHRHHK